MVNTISGTNGGETLFGSSMDDFIYGYNGNDLILGGIGKDTLNGGLGTDTLRGGGDGDVYLYDYMSAPRIYTDPTNPSLPYLYGLETDIIDGFNASVDKIDISGLFALENVIYRSYQTQGIGYSFETSSNGNQILVVTLPITSGAYPNGQRLVVAEFTHLQGILTAANVIIGPNQVVGNRGDNFLYGSIASNYIVGEGGQDTIRGSGGNDTIATGSGNDLLYGDDGNDLIYAGTGNDTLYGLTENDTLNGEEGNDYVVGHEGNDFITGGNGNDLLIGGEGNDILRGDGDQNTLYGGGGGDYLIGVLRSTVVLIDERQDFLYGGQGNDTFYAVYGLDTVVENANEGTDLVYSDFNYTLGANLENLRLQSYSQIGVGNELNNVIIGTFGDNILRGEDGNDYLFGDDPTNPYIGKDTLFGGNGNDTLDGDKGADSLIGGAGDDVYYIDNRGDVIVENTAQGIDLVYSVISFTLGANMENLTILDQAVFGTVGEGNALSNIINGSKGHNVLFGHDGNDLIAGGGDIDFIYGGNETDFLYGDDGDDIIFGEVGADYLYGGAGNDRLNGYIGGDGNDYFIGGAGNDLIELSGVGNTVSFANAVIDGYIEGIDEINIYNGSGNVIRLTELFNDLGFSYGQRTYGIDFGVVNTNANNYALRIDGNHDGVLDTTIANIGVSSGTLDSSDFVVF